MTTYTITDIAVGKRVNGIAGQYSYTAEYVGTIADSTGTTSARERVQFVGTDYGDSVILISSMGAQVRIDRSVRDAIGGRLSPAWVRRYLSRSAGAL